MSTADRRSRRDILVLLGPGFGHYVPIAAFLERFVPSDVRVVMAAAVPADHSMAKRIVEDGHVFVPLPALAKRSFVKRATHRVVHKGLTRAIQRLAATLPAETIPSLAARSVFAVRSYLRENIAAAPERVAFLRELIRREDPRVIFVDSVNAGPLAELCGEMNVPWIEYATGPASVVESGRPIYPAGLRPVEHGLEASLNKAFVAISHVRHRLAASGAPTETFRDADRRIAFTAAKLDDYQARPQHQFDYVGASLYRERGESARANTRRSIYVTFGSAGLPSDDVLLGRITKLLLTNHPEYDVVVQTARDATRQALANIAAATPGARFRTEGARTAPAYDIYADSALVVGHGGHNTVVEALAFGAPVLVVANIAADRMEVARRLVENNCGSCVNYYRFDDDVFEREARRLLEDNTVRENVTRIREQLLDLSRQQELATWLMSELR